MLKRLFDYSIFGLICYTILVMKTAIKLSLLSLALIPLIVDQKVFFPYTSGKSLFLQSALVLAGILILINYFYSRSFREEIIEKVTKYIKNPLVLSVTSFIFVYIISTIFAVDKYSAFWGDLSRAEGLVGILFFFSFFVFSLIIFEKKDWLLFFKLSLLASLILLGKEFTEFFSGITRPGSFTGNPTFLAGYLLYSIGASLIVLNEMKDSFFKYLSIITIILSVLGIFIAQTRGTILGLGVGIIVALIYCAFKGKGINYKKLNLRKISGIILIIGIIFSGVFVLTRQNEIWQKVPGLSRVAVIGTGESEDISTPVRFFLYKSSLKSVNPVQNGWKKFIIGWGPDNFILAESQNYDPRLYIVEPDWHDRAHNKFLDVLVMNGVFGLLAYLAIWFTFFKFLFKKSAPRSLCPTELQRSGIDEVGLLTNLALLFFSISYLAHLLFVFDTISTSIPFFFILAFSAYLTSTAESDRPGSQTHHPALSKAGETRDKQEILTGAFLVVLTLFLGYFYSANTLQGYVQMRDYTSLINNAHTENFEVKIDSVFTPFTVAQMNIRRDFLAVANDLYNKDPSEVSLNLLKKAAARAEEYVTARSMDFKFQTTLADFYTKKGNSLKNLDYLKRGEELLKKILAFAPNRVDMIHLLSHNLLYQNRFLEAFNTYESSFMSDLDVISQDKLQFEEIYTNLIKYFYEQKDKENFIKVANRLKENNYEDSVSLDKILDYLNTNGVFPRVNFE